MECVRRFCAAEQLSAADMRLAVRFSLEEFADRYPGHSVEIRIPWIGAVQAIRGVNHRRGTPPNVVEMDGISWLQIATGITPEGYAPVCPEDITYSGAHADLSPYLPLFSPAQLRSIHPAA